MGRRGRSLVAAIDAVLMAGVAYAQTGVPRTLDAAVVVLWGAVLAAALCALVISSDGSSVVAWIAIGYVLFGGLLTRGAPHWLLIGLAVALVPLVPRPRGSLVVGLGMAALAAIAARYAVALLL